MGLHDFKYKYTIPATLIKINRKRKNLKTVKERKTTKQQKNQKQSTLSQMFR